MSTDWLTMMGQVARCTGKRARRSRILHAAARGAMLLTLAGVVVPFGWAHDSRDEAPATLVNPFVGTGTKTGVFGQGNTYPGAAAPFGMLTWSPATSSRPPGSGYFYTDHAIRGFGLTHLSGVGCNAGGVIPILPTVGPIGRHPRGRTEAFSHKHEAARPGSYEVMLAPGTPDAIAVHLATTARTGLGSFTFPRTGVANVLFKVADAQGTTSTATVEIVGNNRLSGSDTAGHFCGTGSGVTVYFVAEFNRPFTRFGSWSSGIAPAEGARRQTAPEVGAWVSFDARHDQTVKLKVAISYVSVADAWKNLKTEATSWSVDKVARDTLGDWNKLLSRITVAGGTHDQRVQFYTALYHALLGPNIFSDVNGKYLGFDNKVHTLPATQSIQYANFSGWDIYRSEVPLLALVVPRRVGDMVSSLLNDKEQGGWLPKWPFANTYTGVMSGDSADPIIADAYAFGVRNFDARRALSAMVKGATELGLPQHRVEVRYRERPRLRAYRQYGYVPSSSSQTSASDTLEYSLDDFTIARFAEALGDAKVAGQFSKYGANWVHVFDQKATFRGFSGYVLPRSADGQFAAGPAFQLLPETEFRWQPGFTEGNTAQYSWMVPQDLKGLIERMGGDRIVNARLDVLFEHLNAGERSPYYWAGNEPGFGIPWVYDYTGEAWKTQRVVRRILSRLYSNSPGGLPGNDDLGGISSWLVWADMGIYPETPGTGVLVVGAPIFPRVTLRVPGGVVNIVAHGAATKHYVNRVRVNGHAWTKDWFPVSLLLGTRDGRQRTDLHFEMAEQPNPQWGEARADRPPSW